MKVGMLEFFLRAQEEGRLRILDLGSEESAEQRSGVSITVRPRPRLGTQEGSPERTSDWIVGRPGMPVTGFKFYPLGHREPFAVFCLSLRESREEVAVKH